MSSKFKRGVARGFTLIELLIVVIILAILAAIAIPQFSASTSDAQMAALDSNLATVRSALEQYKVQHLNVYPGTSSASTAKCAGGTDPTAPAAGEVGIKAQLTGFTNSTGLICAAGDPVNFKYGPYLRQGLPTEPFSNSNSVTVVTVNPIVGVANGTGWAYNVTTGQFASNNLNPDATGSTRKFVDH